MRLGGGLSARPSIRIRGVKRKRRGMFLEVTNATFYVDNIYYYNIYKQRWG